MKKQLALCLAVCLLLTGCSGWLDGDYVSVTPYEAPDSALSGQIVTVANYGQLCQAIRTLVHSGASGGLISMARYDQTMAEYDMMTAIRHISTNDPIAAYAVDKIHGELGTSGGQTAIALQIDYIHDRSEIRRIRRVNAEDDATEQIAMELSQYSTA